MRKFDFFNDDEDFINYIQSITGHNYEFAEASARKWNSKNEDGNFFQIMPLDLDDGFFDWYILKCPTQQFFRLKEEAVLRFIRYWIEWKQLNEKT